MSSDIRASSPAATQPPVRQKQPDTRSDSPFSAVGAQSQFNQVLERQVQARQDAQRLQVERQAQYREDQDRQDQIRQQDDDERRTAEARQRQESGKSLPSRRSDDTRQTDDVPAKPASETTTAKSGQNSTGSQGKAQGGDSQSQTRQAAQASEVNQAKANQKAADADSGDDTDTAGSHDVSDDQSKQLSALQQADQTEAAKNTLQNGSGKVADKAGGADTVDQGLQNQLAKGEIGSKSDEKSAKDEAGDDLKTQLTQEQLATQAKSDTEKTGADKGEAKDKKDKSADKGHDPALAIMNQAVQQKAAAADDKADSADENDPASVQGKAKVKADGSAILQAMSSSDGAKPKSDAASANSTNAAPDWALGPKETLAQQSNEMKNDADKLAPPNQDQTSAVKQQLVALAQQMTRSASAASQKIDDKKTQSDSDVKGISFSRSLEQIGTARTDSAKPPLSTGIQTPVYSKQWTGELGQRLVMMVSSKIKSAEIHLNPKDLGPLEVHIKMHDDKANVVFTSHVAQTRHALEAAVPRLRDMMDQNGVALGNVDVQDQGAQQSQQRQGSDQRGGGRHSRSGGDIGQVEAPSNQPVQHSISLVDFYA